MLTSKKHDIIITMAGSPQILVVDDEEANVKLLEAHLLPHGYQVLTASSGEQAIYLVKNNKIDLILLDVMMPGLNGFDVTRKLREDKSSRLVPVVLVTALKDTENRIKGIEAGCDDFISKPFDKNEILARVKMLLKLAYYRNLLDEKAKFEYIIDNMGSGIIIFDKELKIERVNQTAKNLLFIGDKPEVDFIGYLKSQFGLHYDGDIDSDIRVKGCVFYLERVGNKAVRALVLSVNTNIIKNSLGDPESIVLIIKDVTVERKEEKDKQNFLNLISHKMRTPLVVIGEVIMQMEAGLLGAVTDKQKTFLAKGSRYCFNLRSLIDKLFGFMEISQAISLMDPEVTELKDYLPALIAPIVKYSEGKKIEVDIVCPAQLATTMNKVYFDMIIDNLMENAVKFSNKEVVHLQIQVEKNGSQLELAMSDDGPGIPVEDKEKIFEKFYQIDRYDTGNVEGVGLGLAIVRYIVERHGGTAWVESKFDMGAKFIVTLPAVN